MACLIKHPRIDTEERKIYVFKTGDPCSCCHDVLKAMQECQCQVNIKNNYQQFQQGFTQDLLKIRPFLVFYLVKTNPSFTLKLLKIYSTYSEHTYTDKVYPRLTQNLPKIHSGFTQKSIIFGILLSENFPRIYPGFWSNFVAGTLYYKCFTRIYTRGTSCDLVRSILSMIFCLLYHYQK